MDGLCMKAGIIGITAPITVGVGGGGGEIRANPPSHIAAAVGRTAASSVPSEKPSISGSPSRRIAPWGFSFKYPLKSLWPGSNRNRHDAVAVDDAVSVDEEKEEEIGGGDDGGRDGNWVMKIMHVRSLWKEENGEIRGDDEAVNELDRESQGGDDEEDDDDDECDACRVNCGEKIEFDKSSFSKLLRRVTLTEARLYARMSYLGSLAYSIPQIKPRNLLKNHGLRFVTSSIEKKAQQALKAEKEKMSDEDVPQGVEEGSEKKAEDVLKPEKENEVVDVVEEEELTVEAVELIEEKNDDGNRISTSTAYQIAASAASYLHSHTKSVLPFKSSKPSTDGNSPETDEEIAKSLSMSNADMVSLMATTDSVTAVVAAKEEVKQAVADDLNSTRSSPCEWFICDDDQTGTRHFVIQGSESLASWQANLLFEPIQFEALDVIVHRGIYEAAKGIYEQMLPEVQAHLKARGDRATFRFTGHSLGGSLSLLVNLMLLIRGEAPRSSLLPVITFGAPSVMCGGDRLLRDLGLPRSHLQAITMHRDIVPRAFSCNYPDRVAHLLKAVNANFRNHPCLNNQSLLYAPMGEFLILQPDAKLSPHHQLLPSGSGLYLLTSPVPDSSEAEKQVRAAQSVFLNTPHPLEILSDRSAYGSEGTIMRDHDMDSYLKSVRSVIRLELNKIRKERRELRRKAWWPLVAPRGTNSTSIVMGRPVVTTSGNFAQGQLNFSGVLQTGRDSLKRFTRLVASQHMHLLVVLLFPARLLVSESNIINLG